MRKPKISVLSLAFNHSSFIGQAISTFANQVGDFDMEILICDDHSTDGTDRIVAEIAKKDSRVSLVRRNSNIGMKRNFVKGLYQCDADYIAYCDGDDFWMAEDKLARQLDALRSMPYLSFSFHDMMIVNEKGIPIRRHNLGRRSEQWPTGPKQPSEILSAPLLVCHASSVLLRRDAIDFEFLNGIRDDVTGIDYAICVMACAHGKGYFINEPLGAYRVNTSSVSARRSHVKTDVIIKEVENSARYMSSYYSGRFQIEIKNNARGHRMQYYVTRMRHNQVSGDLLKAAYYFIRAASISRLNHYTIRDLLWILRNKMC